MAATRTETGGRDFRRHGDQLRRHGDQKGSQAHARGSARRPGWRLTGARSPFPAALSV